MTDNPLARAAQEALDALGVIGRFGGRSVMVSDAVTGPYALAVGPRGPILLPRTRPSIRFPLYEAAAGLDPKLTPWYFDPAKWPDRVPIDYSRIGL